MLTEIDIRSALSRHMRADWGDLDEHDKAETSSASRKLSPPFRVSVGGRHEVLVITEADRSVTTVLLPEDY